MFLGGPGRNRTTDTRIFKTLKIIVFDSRNIAEPCRQTRCPIRTETLGSRWNNMELGGLDRIQLTRMRFDLSHRAAKGGIGLLNE